MFLIVPFAGKNYNNEDTFLARKITNIIQNVFNRMQILMLSLRDAGKNLLFSTEGDGGPRLR